MLDCNAFVTLLSSLSSCFVVLSTVNSFGLNIPTFDLVVTGCVFKVGIDKSVYKSQWGIGWNVD